jgi:tRNA (adenine22-N1)-methyltransferase
MQLNGRLKLIADKVSVCNFVCDIGTDHAYIPVFLILNSICKRAVASDVNEGPILTARENIRNYGLEDYIKARLGYGLDPIQEEETDTIIIAGMGGTLICEILSKGFEKAKKANRIVLQPMNAIEGLREWLNENGFEIFDEELIDEGEKLYTVICAKWDGCVRTVDKIHFYIGKKLIEKNDPLLKKYLNKKIYHLEKALNEMGEMIEKNSESKGKYIRLKDEMSNILKTL